MLLKAAEDFNIDLDNSWMIGDGKNDIQAGIAVGCKAALISDKAESFGQIVTVESVLDFTNQYL